MSVRYIVGDVLDVLRAMPDASVDLVLSSPPFLALRSYLPADHPDKAKEIGSEPTPGEFIDTLLDVTEECRRVLAPHGSLCFELGDTYAGSGGAGGDYGTGGLRNGQVKFNGSALADRKNKVLRVDGNRLQQGNGWPESKSLCLIPELYRIALVYGFNPLTGRTTPKWRGRNVIRWCRPNPPVGELADKVRPATSDIIVACVGSKRYFDLDAVRGPTARGYSDEKPTKANREFDRRPGKEGRTNTVREVVANPAGAPPLDHWWHDEDDTFDQDAWHIPTKGYKGSHYATWPPALCVKPILAMCPTKVCTTCGKPSERIAETTNAVAATAPRSVQSERRANSDDSNVWRSVVGATHTERQTLGWSDCGHGTWRQGVVLDPFAGSGTTLLVAQGHGRSAIGIDLDDRNVDLARERVGMWLEVEHHVSPIAEVPA